VRCRNRCEVARQDDFPYLNFLCDTSFLQRDHKKKHVYTVFATKTIHHPNAMSAPTEPAITLVQAPWKLKGTVYSFFLYSGNQTVSALEEQKSLLYPPLELDSNFANSKFLGGAGSVQIIRYTESPVGPYDEMLLVPGAYGYDKESTQKDGKVKTEKKKGPRITRIYVSQKYTCWNGRTSEYHPSRTFEECI